LKIGEGILPGLGARRRRRRRTMRFLFLFLSCEQRGGGGGGGGSGLVVLEEAPEALFIVGGYGDPSCAVSDGRAARSASASASAIAASFLSDAGALLLLLGPHGSSSFVSVLSLSLSPSSARLSVRGADDQFHEHTD
jgi:hypothetical protein